MYKLLVMAKLSNEVHNQADEAACYQTCNQVDVQRCTRRNPRSHHQNGVILLKIAGLLFLLVRAFGRVVAVGYANLLGGVIVYVTHDLCWLLANSRSFYQVELRVVVFVS